MAIAVLDEETVNLIAAGEVIERPASILKELLENSLDANSNRIHIEVMTGKSEIDRIKITDNGSGIASSEVATAFLPHATSKIRNGGDLDNCLTLGFRGEALPSIAAIAQVSIITRQTGKSVGYRLLICGGKILEKGEIGAPDGTTVIVEDIFYTTPARRKFLKSLQTELSHLLKVVELAALTRPDVNFQYFVNGQEKISTHGSGGLIEVIKQLYGDEAGHMLAVSYEMSGVSVRGYISEPSVFRQNSQKIQLSVNSRVINSTRIVYAIKRGYGTLLANPLYPMAVLGIALNPTLIDVNIHPTKREVKFSDENLVIKVVTDAVRSTLKSESLVFSAELKGINETKATKEIVDKPLIDNNTHERFVPQVGVYSERVASSKSGQSSVCAETLAGYRATTRQIHQTCLPVGKALTKPHEDISDLTYIGQVNDMYLVAENAGGDMVLIDQHAAHERIRYDMLKAAHESGVRTQELIVPVVLSLSPSESTRMSEIIPVLKDEGFIVEPFGKDSWCVRGVPVVLGKNEDPGAVKEILGSALTGGDVSRLGEAVMKMTACRGAIKAGAMLTSEQAEELIRQLAHTAEPYTCPHGRPTIITFLSENLEKMFKRT